MKFTRTFVLGIDGLPYSWVSSKLSDVWMPNLFKLCKQGSIKRISSVIPTISSVAWTSYATGENPGEHNIYGFVDRCPNPLKMSIPTSRDRKRKTIWDRLSAQGMKVIVINVPLTYPPEAVNGKMVSCFLCTNLEKGTFPRDFYKYLRSKGYVIDADTWKAKDSRKEFLDELFTIMKKRFEITFDLMVKEDWDFFQLHIMETDRLFHFFWDDIMSNSCLSERVDEFFRELDLHIGELLERLPHYTRLIILSDHGFCGIKYECNLNIWLQQQGFLKFNDNVEKRLNNYHEDTLCYSLLPGRIYLNLKGREEHGTVEQKDYSRVRELIRDKLLQLKSPDGTEHVVEKVFFKEDLYSGHYLYNAPDIIAHPHRGYDLKGAFSGSLFTRSHLNGMHTYDDAVIIGRNEDIAGVESIMDVAERILGGKVNDSI
ncbi:MAG: alkaline phosphatase family protein [Caulobacteraceae bacterium]